MVQRPKVIVNYNGQLCRGTEVLPFDNRGFAYGDAVFDTLAVASGQIRFWEDHYFRMMSGMRVLRMCIPTSFTMDFLQQEIERVLDAPNARVRITLFREAKGFYTAERGRVGYLIATKPLGDAAYSISDEKCEVALFTDFYVQQSTLNNIKSTNRALHVVAGVFARENAYDNCLLLNDSKQLVGAINGNLFLISGAQLITPSPDQGCIKGIFRKNLLRFVTENHLFEVVERPITPFELTKATEVFITNVISGIIPVTHYRKKIFSTEKTKALLKRFNSTR